MADDDLTSRELLRVSLQSEPEIEVVGTASSGLAVVEAIEGLRPDLVFLDVEMPELDGFAVIERVGTLPAPVVVFVTSHEHFACKAFEVQAVDYLVKPWNRQRFQLALARAKEEIYRTKVLSKLEQSQADPVPSRDPAAYPDRLAVKAAGRIRFIRTLEIDWIEAADNYVVLHVGSESHFLRETMIACEARLSPKHFQRISRSTIVNLERIKELQPLFHGDYSVILRNGTNLTLSRRFRHKIPQLG